MALITHPLYVLSADYGKGSGVTFKTIKRYSIEELAALDAIKLRPAQTLCASIAIPVEQKVRFATRGDLKKLKLASALALSRDKIHPGNLLVVTCLEEIRKDRVFVASSLNKDMKKVVGKWIKNNPNAGLTDLEKSILNHHQGKIAAEEAEKREFEEFVLAARDQIANFSKYKPAVALQYVNPSSLEPKLPERGTYESKKEYEARKKNLTSVKRDITTRHFYGPVEVRVNSTSEFAYFSVSIKASENEEIDKRTDSWEAQNAFGARATFYKEVTRSKRVTIKDTPTPWIDMRPSWTDCYGKHDHVPLDLEYVKEKNADVKLVRIADFNLSDPKTYDFDYSSEEPTFIDPFGYEFSTNIIQGDLRAIGLVDANDDNKVLAVFSQDLKTLHRFVPEREDFSLDRIGCSAEQYSWD